MLNFEITSIPMDSTLSQVESPGELWNCTIASMFSSESSADSSSELIFEVLIVCDCSITPIDPGALIINTTSSNGTYLTISPLT